MKKSEKQYYDDQFKTNAHNLRKSWCLIKDIINKKKSVNMDSKFKINGEETTNKSKIVQGFNKYYINVGKSLADKIPNKDTDPTSFIKDTNIASMFINSVTPEEVATLFQNLKNASPGWDGLHSKIVKCTYKSYLDVITHVFNLSIMNGVFPTELKKAKVIPLYKCESPMLLNNYRPVSVLPVFSKILERLMYNRLLSFINKHNLLYKLQFGFREKHGTDTALIILIDKIMSAINEDEIVLGVFLDLSKAFDTVNHKILLMKMYKYGIRGVALSWFESYLSNRNQYVSFSNHNSESMLISCGVPQGSILGPLLFLLYVNDMPNVSSVLFTILFADDTNVFVQGKSLDHLIDVMNNELCKLSEWMAINKLSLNVKKTKCMIFSLRKEPISSKCVTLNGEIIDKVRTFKFLGVIIDDKLRWTDHVLYIKNKLSKGIGIICKAKRVLSSDTLLTLYNCFIYPYVVYCIEVWGAVSMKYLMSVLRLQKRVVRIILSVPVRTESFKMFNYLKILSVFDVYIFRLSMFAFKYENDLLAECFTGFFIKNSEIHSYATRQAEKMHVPKYNKTAAQTIARYRCVKVWNYVSTIMSTQCSIISFKSNLNSFFLKYGAFDKMHHCVF